jgi:hypoxanthine phosphoribosyltransferase
MTLEEAKDALADAERVFDQAQVEAALDHMADRITRELADSDPVVLCAMNGGLIVAGHLLTRLSFPLQLGYIHVTRYRGQTRGGKIHWHKKPLIPLQDRTVLVIDDILDEGHTLAEIFAYCRTEGARQVSGAVLVDKRHDHKLPNVDADFVGLTIDDRYLFGFGMDYRGYLRNLPEIYAAKAT